MLALWKLKVGPHDADDLVRRSAQVDRAPDYRGICTESPPPQAVAKNHDAVLADLLFLAREPPAQCRTHPKKREEIGREASREKALRLARSDQIEF